KHIDWDFIIRAYNKTMTFGNYLKLNGVMKKRGQNRVRPLPSCPDKPHCNEINSVHHYMLVLNKYKLSQPQMQP
ncbi:hypothetical protein VOE27_09860, partial [Escherichia coli]|nr:hypothetical protein [Escherichia coli]